MVQHLFTKLPQFVDDTRILPNMKVSFINCDDKIYIFVYIFVKYNTLIFKKMRTNSIENTRSKNRKHKSYTKQKSKSITDDVDEKEPLILSSVDRNRTNHLATTPVSPAGNIVDMQGSLDHGSIDKNEDEKNESKIDTSKDSKINKCNKAVDNQETNKKQENDKDVNNIDSKNETETTEVNDTSENVNAENKTVVSTETKIIEKEDAVDQKNTMNKASEFFDKQSELENQGTCHFKA